MTSLLIRLCPNRLALLPYCNAYHHHNTLLRRPLTTSKMVMKKILDDSDENMRKAKEEISDLKDKQLYAEYEQIEKGWVYDKKPFKYECIQGKAYVWCSCGRSHKQPFCDGTHKNHHLKIKLKPIRWDCTETKEYWFCNCKQTKHPPFCDGTHKLDFIQNGQSTIRDAHSPPVVQEKFSKK